MDFQVLDKRKDPEHKKRIAEKRKVTSARRKLMRAMSAELKVVEKSLSKETKEYLDNLFQECKVFYNYLIAQTEDRKKRIGDFSYKIHDVIWYITISHDRKTKERKLEERKVRLTLPSNIKLGILSDFKNSIKGLHESKKKGRKIGKLKYKKSVDSISFRSTDVQQPTNTWMKKTDTSVIKVEDSKWIKISGLSRLKVNGIKQIPAGAEIRDAKLVRRASGYYIYLNTSIPWQEETGTTPVGLDFGIKTSITTSDGQSFNSRVEPSNKLKNLQRRLSKKDLCNKNKKKSNRYLKVKKKMNHEYERIGRKKDALANNIVSQLRKNYSIIALQDENLKGWKSSGLKGFGRRVQFSVLGRVKSMLVNDAKRGKAIVIDRAYPTTKLCLQCGRKLNIELGESIFKCKCGYVEDRDVKAAKTILALATGQIVYNLNKKKKIKK